MFMVLKSVYNLEGEGFRRVKSGFGECYGRQECLWSGLGYGALHACNSSAVVMP